MARKQPTLKDLEQADSTVRTVTFQLQEDEYQRLCEAARYEDVRRPWLVRHALAAAR